MRLMMIGAGAVAAVGLAVGGYVMAKGKPEMAKAEQARPAAPKTMPVSAAPAAPQVPARSADPLTQLAAAPPAANPQPPAGQKAMPPQAPQQPPAKTASAPPANLKPGKLSGDQVKGVFFNGETFYASTPQGVKYKMVFAADGKMKREPLGKAGGKSEGTYKVQKDGFCTQWTGSQQNCYGMVYGNSGTFSVMKGTTIVGTWQRTAFN
jgi:hypothetical protein